MSVPEDEDKPFPPLRGAPHDRLIQDILSQKLVAPSMGALVADQTCTLCGAEHHDEWNAVGNTAVKVAEVDSSGFEVISFGLVAAPDHCGESMEFTGPGTTWTCETCGNQTNPGFGGLVTESTL